MIEKIEQVTVLANDFHVETSSTQASEVATGTAVTALHVRGFTGLMALQPSITRASTGFAVTISSDGGDSLMGSVPNGVNNHLDLPGYAPGWLNLIFEPPKTEGCTSTGRCSVRTLWERPAQPRAARLMDPAW
jgi:hypothetical protein